MANRTAKATPKPNVAAARLAGIMGDPERLVYKQFTAAIDQKRVDTEARTVRFVITTDGVDRDNDVIDPKGWEVDDFVKSPVVLWAHDYSMPPVARALDVTPTARGLESTAQFPTKGIYPFADMVFDLIKDGFLNASSVGFRPLEAAKAEDRDGLNFSKQSLLEWSIVPVPANAEALVVARSKGISLAPMKAWAQKYLAAEKDVPAPGTASEAETICPACGMQYPGDQCPGCSHSETPMETPRAASVARAAAVDGQRIGRNAFDAVKSALPPVSKVPSLAKVPDGLPRVAVDADGKRWQTHAAADNDDIRWNRQLSKAFDVAGEPVQPASVELGWVSRYLETPIQDLSVSSYDVRSARMGSYLSAQDELLGGWHVDALRRLSYGGNEVPPEFEHVQLNSTKAGKFLVEGMRFMRRDDGVKIVQRVERMWYGLDVTHYVRRDQHEALDAWTSAVWQRAGQLNFLKGEAFTLGGEFLDRGSMSWDKIYLDPAVERVVRRLVERVNELGAELESRGCMLMGPPGTGKTLTGRVMMAQTAPPAADKAATFVHISARDFYRMGAFGAFTYAFDIAAECAPTILFFEDVDNWLIGSDTIDLLKTEMDGLKRRKGVVTVLTTNFPELMPEALMDRPGRFHDVVEMALPGEDVRVRMLTAWAAEAGTDVLAQLAKDTESFSGAHLYELVHYARTLAQEEQTDLAAALPKALAKIQEQRALIVSMRGGSDYRPRRAVRAAVAIAKSMHAARLKAMPPGDDEEDDDENEEAALVLTDGAPDADEEVAMELTDEADEPVSDEELRAVLSSGVKDALASIVREETQAALARARGRVD